MFAVTVKFILNPGRASDFLPLMLGNARASVVSEPGCRQFDICSDPDRPDEIFLYELYDSPEAFQAHLKTPHFLSFEAAVGTMVAEKTVTTYRRVNQ